MRGHGSPPTARSVRPVKTVDLPHDKPPMELVGCIRTPNRQRLKEGSVRYKKGHEVRLKTETRREATRLRRWLRSVGLRAGGPYAHHSYYIVPVYGSEAVKWFRANGGHGARHSRISHDADVTAGIRMGRTAPVA